MSWYAEDSKDTIIVDIDGVIAKPNPEAYGEAEPLQHGIEQVNKLFDAGFYIILFTARYGDREKGNIHRQYQRGYVELLEWTKKVGVRCNEIRLGKPPAVLYIDDKAAHVAGDSEDGWSHVWKQVEALKNKDKYGREKVEGGDP